MGLRPRLTAAAGVLALVASTISFAVAAPAALSAGAGLPPSTNGYPVCATPEQYWCVETVTFERAGMPPAIGTWIPAAQVVSAVPGRPTSTKNSYPGVWSFEDQWPGVDMGYDGIYLEAKPASEGSDFLWIRVQPANARGNGTVGQAITGTPSLVDGFDVVQSLDPDTTVSAVIRIEAGLEMSAGILMGNGLVKQSDDEAGDRILFTGSPTSIPQARTQADCTGEAGRARAVARQLYAFVVFSNLRQGYGYDGMTGGLNILSNGPCYLSTPTYDPATGEFSFVAAAPHFAEDGVTVNRGFYQAVIPLEDATILFGITELRQVKAALEVVVENEAGEEVPVQYSVAAARGLITITYRNFQYSKQIVTVKVKAKLWKKYKKIAAAAQKKASGG